MELLFSCSSDEWERSHGAVPSYKAAVCVGSAVLVMLILPNPVCM